MSNFRLNKSHKDLVAKTLALRAVKDPIAELDKKCEDLSKAYWLAYDAEVQQMLPLDPRRWEALLQAEMLRPCYSEVLSNEEVHLPKDSPRRRFMAILRYNSAAPKLIDTVGWGHRLSVYARAPSVRPNLATDLPQQFHERADALLEEFVRILHQGIKLYDDLQDLMRPMRNYSRMVDLLPEGAKLIKKPDPKQDLIPAELVSSVRSRLESGVPQ